MLQIKSTYPIKDLIRLFGEYNFAEFFLEYRVRCTLVLLPLVDVFQEFTLFFFFFYINLIYV